MNDNKSPLNTLSDGNIDFTIQSASKEDINYLNIFYSNQLNKLKNNNEISIRANSNYKSWYSRNALKEKIISSESEDREFLIAKDINGKIIGVIDGRYGLSDNFIINWLLVDEKSESKGIGTSLMNQIIETSKKKANTVISFHGIENIKSERTHNKHNFCHLDGEAHPYIEGLYGPGFDGVMRVKNIDNKKTA